MLRSYTLLSLIFTCRHDRQVARGSSISTRVSNRRWKEFWHFDVGCLAHRWRMVIHRIQRLRCYYWVLGTYQLMSAVHNSRFQAFHYSSYGGLNLRNTEGQNYWLGCSVVFESSDNGQCPRHDGRDGKVERTTTCSISRSISEGWSISSALSCAHH